MSAQNPTASPLQGRSELGMAALLGAAGALVLWDAVHLHAPYSESDPVGPRAVPYLISALLIGCAVWLATDVLRGGKGVAEEGEDVDLEHPTEWRTVVPLVGVFLANVLLVDRLGWVVSGALFFWGSVWALGSRHYVRDAVISVVLSVATFYGFYLGLGIYLPSGVLQGVL